jgi:hypothetical protein
MRRRLLASLSAIAAVAASLLIGSAVPATAADTTADPTPVAQSAGSTSAEKIPSELNIPPSDPGYKIVATLRGVGKQVYECKADGLTYEPAAVPVAVLNTPRGATVGIHGQGPFWAHFDGSKVIAALPPLKVVPSTDPSKNIPRLLLKAQSTTGTGGTFSKVGYIQRIDTKGGVAPTACNGRQTVAVDYSATYVFWAK